MQLDFQHLFCATGSEAGLTPTLLETACNDAAAVATQVKNDYEAGNAHQFLNLSSDITALTAVRDALEPHTQKNLLILGMGGSSLGSHMLVQALGNSETMVPCAILDTIDPETVNDTLADWDASNTLVHIITKSGATVETIALAKIVLHKLQQAVGDDWAQQVLITTGESPLRKWAQSQNITVLPVPENVSGRFSVLSPVGLVTTEQLQLDSEALLRGATTMRDQLLALEGKNNPALAFAVAMQILSTTFGKSELVVMPYADRLLGWTLWFRQLWAESLGKRRADGSSVGQTPVAALGVADQHSQLQLYMEGPANKVLLFLNLQQQQGCNIPTQSMSDLKGFDFLQDKNLSDLVHAEQQGTEMGLFQAGRPACRLQLQDLGAESLGSLIVFFEMVVAYSGALYGIDPYNQPGVEGGKVNACALLGKQGSESLRERLLAAPESSPSQAWNWSL